MQAKQRPCKLAMKMILHHLFKITMKILLQQQKYLIITITITITIIIIKNKLFCNFFEKLQKNITLITKCKK